MTPTIVPNADQLRMTADMDAHQLLMVMQKRHSAGLAATHHEDAFDPEAFGRAATGWARQKDYYQSYDPDYIYSVLSGRLDRDEPLHQYGDSWGVAAILQVYERLEKHPNYANARVF